MARVISLAALCTLAACGSSVAGTATGRCRIHYGSVDPAPILTPHERTDPATVRLADAEGDAVRVSVAGCELFAERARGEGGLQYVVTSGTCHADVPGVGLRTFSVANRPVTHAHTEDTGEEAHMSLYDREVSLVFEAPVPPGEVRFVCDATRP